ncbi:hypothetical protein BN8_01415 [Fibrisoma limi BUZ 3]|uniref:Uncharacterized protein n=1 Tax=Fibrisoma limi BUZ 3 TaxID=1185876 RepID=I2GET8_9BACT|nr:hypothetical protein BN8_01415 [Fibrisoma limi BUZ 3]
MTNGLHNLTNDASCNTMGHFAPPDCDRLSLGWFLAFHQVIAAGGHTVFTMKRADY